MNESVGGLTLKSWDFDKISGGIIASKSSYNYCYFHVLPGESMKLAANLVASVYCNDGTVEFQDESSSTKKLSTGGVLNCSNFVLELKTISATPAKLFVASKVDPGSLFSLELVRAKNIKKVTKPWGFELWLNGEHPEFAFKFISIRKGFQTSLQFHNLKDETNLLLRGRAAVYYCSNISLPSDKVSVKDTEYIEINSGVSIDVPPPRVHRIKAITDIDLLEVSTPHLDDVVRLSDDSGRGDGRIESEHNGR